MDVLRNTQKNLMAGQEKLEEFERTMQVEMVGLYIPQVLSAHLE